MVKSKSLLILLMLMTCVVPSFAYDFTFNGLYYNILSTESLTCEITSNSSTPNSYSGNIVIPEKASYKGRDLTVIAIGDRAFEGCSTLNSVSIPVSVSRIGHFAFKGCPLISKVELPNNLLEIGESAFAECKKLESVNIPNGLKRIWAQAFLNCQALKSVSVPQSVETIAGTAFEGCDISTYYCDNEKYVDLFPSIKKLFLKKHVYYIQYTPTAWNNSLEELYVYSATPPTFGSCSLSEGKFANLKVFVPEKSLEIYKSAEIWRKFWEMEAIPKSLEEEDVEYSLVSNEITLENSSSDSFVYQFDAPEKWRAASNADWCRIYPIQGVAGNGQSLTIEVSSNSNSEERTCEISIESICDAIVFNRLTIKQPEKYLSDDINQSAPEGMELNAAGLVKQIRVGWNLGHSCECGIWDGYTGNVDADGETNWGNPKTTKTMFTALEEAGFNAVRIPCRWYIHADDNLNIRQAWLARVKEIVDYAVSQDMYVILNSNHDNWYDRLPVGYNEAKIHNKFENMWSQIATYFKDYDEHLIFAGMNEVIKLDSKGNEDWGTPTNDNIAFLNNLNQLFVNTVRNTGGNNAWRCLMVQPWACSPTNALNNAFTMPVDNIENRLIVEFHCYDPYNYCIGKDIKGNQWAQHEYTQNDLDGVSNILQKMAQRFVDASTPVIMAEFGSTQDNCYTKGNDAADKLRADYHKFIVSEAKKYGIPGFYWDNGCFTTYGENFGLLDRKTCTFPARAQIALKGIMDGLGEVSSAIESTTVTSSSDIRIEYFTIDGRKVSNPSNGIFIIRDGRGSTKKILVK